MLTSINEEVIKAREVVAAYKTYNQATTETFQSYDPVLKVWTYKKVNIDPNAKVFKKEFIKSSKAEKKQRTAVTKIKAEKTAFKKPKKIKVPNPVKVKVKREPKPVIEKVLKPKPIKVEKPKKVTFDPNTIRSKVYALHLEGKTNKEIAETLSMPTGLVINNIYMRKKQLGIYFNPCQTRSHVIKYLNEGYRVSEMAELLNLSHHVISHHIKLIDKNKDEAQKEADYQEILDAIKRKAQLYEVDYCYSSWVNQGNCRLKSNLTTPQRNRKMKELVALGRLEEIPEGFIRSKGIMYKIPKK